VKIAFVQLKQSNLPTPTTARVVMLIHWRGKFGDVGQVMMAMRVLIALMRLFSTIGTISV